jgi:hypothetical protein
MQCSLVGIYKCFGRSYFIIFRLQNWSSKFLVYVDNQLRYYTTTMTGDLN